MRVTEFKNANSIAKHVCHRSGTRWKWHCGNGVPIKADAGPLQTEAAHFNEGRGMT